MIFIHTSCAMPSRSFLCWTAWMIWGKSQTSGYLPTGNTSHSNSCSPERFTLCIVELVVFVFFLSGTLKPVPSRGRWFSMPVQPTVVKPITPSSATWRPSLEFTVAPWSFWLMRFLRRVTLLYVLGFALLICNASLSPSVIFSGIWNTVYWSICSEKFNFLTVHNLTRFGQNQQPVQNSDRHTK